MITKQDVQGIVKNEIETAVAQISQAISKALEHVATKDDVKKIEVRLDKIEVRLDKIETRLDKIEDDMSALKTELSYVKMELRDLKSDTPTIAEFRHLEKRVAFLEKAVITS